MDMHRINISEIEGFKLGNAENRVKGTGVTVIICAEGAVGGVDVRGGGPATRETDLLRSENTVNAVNAVVLSGGSAFGLEAASGVMRELSDKGIGFRVDNIAVPIVCGASLFDLAVGDSKAFPDIDMGMQAVRNAFRGGFEGGNTGAGTGATVGKTMGMKRAMKTGLGTYACDDGVVQVGAVVAVNAVGDVYNGAGNIIAGLRTENGDSIYGTIRSLKNKVHDISDPGKGSESVRAGNAPVRAPLAARTRNMDGVAAAIARELDRTAVREAKAAAKRSPEDEYLFPEPEAAPADAVMLRRTKAESKPAAKDMAATKKPSRSPVSAGAAAEGKHAASKIAEPAGRPAAEKIPGPAVKPAAAETAAPVRKPFAKEAAATVRTAAPNQVRKQAEDSPEFTREELGYDISFNTTIGCLITNAKLTKAQANKLASILHDAYARAIKPVHSTLDGDTVFVLALGKQEVNFDAFAALATDVMQYAIIDGAAGARSAYGLPAASDM